MFIDRLLDGPPLSSEEANVDANCLAFVHAIVDDLSRTVERQLLAGQCPNAVGRCSRFTRRFVPPSPAPHQPDRRNPSRPLRTESALFR